MFSRHLTQTLLSAVALNMLAACAVLDKKDTAEESHWLVRMFEKDGHFDAEQATMAYSQGNFNKALEYTTEALKANPRNQQALLVGALAAEKMGRFNKARQYYEDLIVINSNDTSILGTNSTIPQKMSDIAKANLKAITIAQSNLTVENRDGTKHFAISEDAGELQSKTTIANALSKKSIPAVRTQPVGVDDIFTPDEQNIVSRFLILKELAEKDFITKEEFLSRRTANIGGLLPLTRQAPGVGINQPVPAPELIIERLNILKDGVESRAITPREFSAERDVIIEALMSPTPRQRLKNKAPSKNILDAANDLRRLEVLYDLDLITESEKNAEKKAVERYLGINRAPIKPAAAKAKPQPVQPEKTVEKKDVCVPENKSEPVNQTTPSATTSETSQPDITDAAKQAEQPQSQNSAAPTDTPTPNVTSPF